MIREIIKNIQKMKNNMWIDKLLDNGNKKYKNQLDKIPFHQSEDDKEYWHVLVEMLETSLKKVRSLQL